MILTPQLSSVLREPLTQSIQLKAVRVSVGDKKGKNRNLNQ